MTENTTYKATVGDRVRVAKSTLPDLIELQGKVGTVTEEMSGSFLFEMMFGEGTQAIVFKADEGQDVPTGLPISENNPYDGYPLFADEVELIEEDAA